MHGDSQGTSGLDPVFSVAPYSVDDCTLRAGGQMTHAGL